METKFYPPLKNRYVESEFETFLKHSNGEVQELSMKDDSDFKKFAMTILNLLQTKHRFSIDVYGVDDIEIGIESKNGTSVIFHTTCMALFAAFSNSIYTQFCQKED